MLIATAQKLGDSTVVRCQGRIIIGDAYRILRNAVLRETHNRTLVLDLAQVDRIDAGGLGVLLGLREWAYSHAIRFRLMNVMNQVELVLELTKLDRVFEFCSVEDMFELLCTDEVVEQWSDDRAKQRILKGDCDVSLKGSWEQSSRHGDLRLVLGGTNDLWRRETKSRGICKRPESGSREVAS